MVIHRKQSIEINRLLSYFPIVGLMGPRQCGKTTMAKILLKEYHPRAIYLDLEWEDDLRRLAEPSFFLESHREELVIIDEIQRRPDLFPLLRSLVDRFQVPGRFLILGSASPEILRNTSESLAGRVANLELTPFRLDEIMNDFEWQRLWLRGGFPGAFLAPDDAMSEDWRRNFIQTYVERDIPMLGTGADPVILNRIIRMLALSHGNLLSYETLSNSLAITAVTLKKYIHLLEHAFILTRIQAYTNNIRKRLVKSPKLFFRDSGLLHSLIRLKSLDEIMGHPMLGASWEGFVISQIIAVAGSRFTYSFYRTHQGAECDLVMESGNQVIAAIEIKFSGSPHISRGFGIAAHDLNAQCQYIIIPGKADYRLTPNIRVAGLDTFIMSILPAL